MRALRRRRGDGGAATAEAAQDAPAGAGSAGAAGGRAHRKEDQGRNQPPAGGKRKHLILGKHPVLSVLAIIATAAITGISLTAYAAYRGVLGRIHHVNVSSRLLGPRPPKLNNSLNILLIGSDSRKGTHGLGYVQGSRSDTSMILHISPVSQRAIVISFPRDSMVQQYSCPAMDKMHPGQPAGAPGTLIQLNATYSDGGPACLWKTLEQTTHIHIDHFVQVNFASFKQIVNDIGGVPVCLPKPIDDPASKLHLSAGKHIVTGAQALAFVRLRHIGYGSDLQRIERQQYFLAAAVQKIKHSGILGNPAQLFRLVNDVASSLTTDSNMTATDLLAIANSMKSMSTKSLRFITVPWAPYPLDPNRVIWQHPLSDRLFRAIARDNERAALRAGKAGKNVTSAPTVSPGRVSVQVLNGTNTTGLAATTATGLQAKGFHVTGTGNSPVTGKTVIEYSASSQQSQLATLQAEVPHAQVKQVTSLKAGTLTLVLGTDFHGLRKHPAKNGGSSGPKIAKSIGGIQGNTNICRDSSAFAGPDTPSQFSP